MPSHSLSLSDDSRCGRSAARSAMNEREHKSRSPKETKFETKFETKLEPWCLQKWCSACMRSKEFVGRTCQEVAVDALHVHMTMRSIVNSLERSSALCFDEGLQRTWLSMAYTFWLRAFPMANAKHKSRDKEIKEYRGKTPKISSNIKTYTEETREELNKTTPISSNFFK